MPKWRIPLSLGWGEIRRGQIQRSAITFKFEVYLCTWPFLVSPTTEQRNLNLNVK